MSVGFDANRHPTTDAGTKTTGKCRQEERRGSKSRKILRRHLHVPDAVDEEDEVAVGGPDDADAVALLQLVEVRAVVLVDAAAVAQDRVAGHYPGWSGGGTHALS